jgi:hypothetical protein
MIDPPKTLEEAQAYVYGHNFSRRKFNPACCAYEVVTNDRAAHRYQCSRKPGHGPSGLYCKQHAETISPTKPPKPRKLSYVDRLSEDNQTLRERVRALEGAIREHKRAAHDGRSPSALKFADHRKLWSLLPD